MSAIGHPDLEFLHQYWVGKKRGRAMPSRADIDPVELPGRLWPNLMLIDVVRKNDTTRFRYRHVGTAFTDAVGEEVTNQYFDEVIPTRGGYRDYILGIYNELLQRRIPLYTENTFTFTRRAAPILTRRLSLPLSADGVTVNMVFAGHTFDYDRSRFENGYLSEIAGLQEVTRTLLENSTA
jgi:hypothetical protein